MAIENNNSKSQLLVALREAVSVVQMIFYKEIRKVLTQKKPDLPISDVALLAGSITNEVFGTQNPDKKFTRFRIEHQGEIEQQLLAVKEELPDLCESITDALRIQTLCDHQEGHDSATILLQAKEYGFLLEDRDLPLPSTFMTAIRILGEKHDLIVPPILITPDQENSVIH